MSRHAYRIRDRAAKSATSAAMSGHDPYGSPMASPAKRTTRPQDLKFVADPNNAQSYDEMKQAASTVESQVNQLKLIVHKAFGGGDFDAALKARKELEGEWWDTKEQMESHKIVSYQQADVYIKRAASRMSTHRKWYATQNKRANKTIEDALEELRLASPRPPAEAAGGGAIVRGALQGFRAVDQIRSRRGSRHPAPARGPRPHRRRGERRHGEAQDRPHALVRGQGG